MINGAVLKLFADVSMFRRNGNTNGSVDLSVCRQSGIYGIVPSDTRALSLACPGMRQYARISALIKPIWLCGTQKAQKKFGPDRQFLTPPYRAEVLMANLLSVRSKIFFELHFNGMFI